MELILYSTKDDDNVINKELNEIDRLTMNIKDNIDLTNPDLKLKLKLNIVNSVNYAEIVDLERKYFIRTVQNVSNDLWVLRLECDVLETYKDDILNSESHISRKISTGDYQDISLESEVRKSVKKYESDVLLENKKTMVLSAIGGF